MKKNQKGFTIVEMIVAIAILAVIGTGVTSLLVSGANNYKKQRQDIDLQYEAQLTINQLQDMIISTTKALNFDVNGDSSEKTFTISDKSSCYEIVWKKSDNRLYYTKYTLSQDASGVVSKTADASADNVLMTQYIDSFDIDLSDAVSRNVVKFNLNFVKDDKSYHTTHNVTLRNKVLINDVDYLKKVVEDPEDDTPQADEVQILQSGNVIESVFNYQMYPTNNSIQFTARVLAKEDATRMPSQDVTWQISGMKSSDTSVTPNGLVILGDDETGPLSLTAISVEDPSVSKTIQIVLLPAKKIEFVGVEEVNSKGEPSPINELHTGDKFYLKPIILIDGVRDPQYSDYEWVIEDKNTASYSKNRNVFTATGQPGDTIVIYAKCTDPYYPDLRTPDWKKTIIDDVSIDVTADKAEVCRGDSVTFTATVSNLTDYNVSWSWKIYSGSMDVTNSVREFFEVVPVGDKLQVFVKTTLIGEQEYTIRATGTLDYKGLSDSADCKIITSKGEFFFLTTKDDSYDVITLDIGVGFHPSGDGVFVAVSNEELEKRITISNTGDVQWWVTKEIWNPATGMEGFQAIRDTSYDVISASPRLVQEYVVSISTPKTTGTRYLYPYIVNENQNAGYFNKNYIYGNGKYYIVVNIHPDNVYASPTDKYTIDPKYIPTISAKDLEAKLEKEGVTDVSDGGVWYNKKYGTLYPDYRNTWDSYKACEAVGNKRWYTPACWGSAYCFWEYVDSNGDKQIRAAILKNQQPKTWVPTNPTLWMWADNIGCNGCIFQLVGERWVRVIEQNGTYALSQYK